MPRQANVSVDYNFSQGLITEATGLNFPENACTETYNCVFDETGPVYRRPQIDFEDTYITETINRSNLAISTYSWDSVADEGDFSLVVVQIGHTLYFYNTAEVSLSRGFISGSQVNLSPFFSSATSQETQECTYATGLGYLFVFHPGMDPIYVSYDISTNTLTASAATIRIRDLVGVDDSLEVQDRPLTLTAAHRYNLYNQGWALDTAKEHTVTFSNGSTSVGWTSHNLSVNDTLYFSTSDTLPTNFSTYTKYYVVSVVNSNTITVSATLGGTAISAGSAGTGTHMGHVYNSEDAFLDWEAARADYPSNADIWWRLKNLDNVFDVDYVDQYSSGSSPAPKGHFVIDLFNQDRNVAASMEGLNDVTYAERPSIGEFYAGRVWYSGIPNSSLNNKIYYSQIVEDITQLGNCYQKYDPTSEDLSILLPTDGGVISILDIGTIHKMKSVGNYLVLFSKTGTWAISGSQGVGFSPTDYSITKVSDIGSISSSNFVDIKSAILWWNDDGIYALRQGQNGLEISSLTDNRIKTFYLNIPVVNKKQARGSYNPNDGVVTWLYRNTVAADVTEVYNYDGILKLNTRTAAFYPWSLSESSVPQVHSIVTPAVTGQSISSAFNVIDGSSDTVIDASGNTVVAFNFATYATSTVTNKYLTSYYNGSSYVFTWASEKPYSTVSSNYLDWYKYDSIGVDYDSYFISGYKLRGQGQRKFQANYLYLFSDTYENLPQYDVSSRWDYSTSSDTGEWTSTQRVAYTDLNYKFQRRRLKVRGTGLTVQFKCSSVTGQPMNVTGWSVFETINTGI